MEVRKVHYSIEFKLRSLEHKFSRAYLDRKKGLNFLWPIDPLLKIRSNTIKAIATATTAATTRT